MILIKSDHIRKQAKKRFFHDVCHTALALHRSFELPTRVVRSSRLAGWLPLTDADADDGESVRSQVSQWRICP